MTTTQTKTLSDTVTDFRFAMLVTYDGAALTSRPLTLQETEGDVLRFLVDDEAEWTRAVDGRAVHLAFADPKGNAFASVAGVGRLTQDRATIERLYSGAADVFFDGADDPRIRLLEVTATSGEWWDGPSGRVGNVLALVAAKVTGDQSKAGDSGTVDLR
jgi:general stress protein 26